MSDFSVAQREAIRHFAESPSPVNVHGSTLKSLLKTEHIVRTSDAWIDAKDEPHAAEFALTEKGVRKFRQIMASGDGPESLKELFRF